MLLFARPLAAALLWRGFASPRQALQLCLFPFGVDVHQEGVSRKPRLGVVAGDAGADERPPEYLPSWRTNERVRVSERVRVGRVSIAGRANARRVSRHPPDRSPSPMWLPNTLARTSSMVSGFSEDVEGAEVEGAEVDDEDGLLVKKPCKTATRALKSPFQPTSAFDRRIIVFIVFIFAKRRACAGERRRDTTLLKKSQFFLRFSWHTALDRSRRWAASPVKPSRSGGRRSGRASEPRRRRRRRAWKCKVRRPTGNGSRPRGA